MAALAPSAGPFCLISLVTHLPGKRCRQDDQHPHEIWGMTSDLSGGGGWGSAWSDFTITTMLSSVLHFLAIELAEESAICHGI